MAYRREIIHLLLYVSAVNREFNWSGSLVKRFAIKVLINKGLGEKIMS